MDTRRVTFLAFRYGVLPISSFSASLCLVFYSTAVRACSVCTLCIHSSMDISEGPPVTVCFLATFDSIAQIHYCHPCHSTVCCSQTGLNWVVDIQHSARTVHAHCVDRFMNKRPCQTCSLIEW
jgi:hypothetical protein